MINKHKKLEINYDFREINDEFRFIENLGAQVIVPINEGEKFLNILKYSNRGVKSVLRKLSGCSINIPNYILRELLRDGCVEQFSDDIFILKNIGMYDLKIGFDKDNLKNYEYII